MAMFNADFDVEVVDGVVVIYDLDQGNRSVTNDAENVVRRVAERLGYIADKPIIYRDSMRVFDGMAVNARGEFTGFYPLGERVLETALNKVRAKWLERTTLTQSTRSH